MLTVLDKDIDFLSRFYPSRDLEIICHYFLKQEFTVQIKCENGVFPLSMTKNDVRRKICQNEKESSRLLSRCYSKEGINLVDEDSILEENPKQLQNMMSLIVSTYSSQDCVFITLEMTRPDVKHQ